MDAIQSLRRAVGRPFKITSGYRCVEHNKAVGGLRGSYHLAGLAVDIAVADSNFRWSVVTRSSEFKLNRVGVYSSFIHLDAGGVNDQIMWVSDD
jgi:uncharacterized protein YcbK (DUF882 family)